MGDGNGATETSDREPDELEGVGHFAKDDPRFEVKDFTAEATKVPVAPAVGGATEAMVRAVHFDDDLPQRPSTRCARRAGHKSDHESTLAEARE